MAYTVFHQVVTLYASDNTWYVASIDGKRPGKLLPLSAFLTQIEENEWGVEEWALSASVPTIILSKYVKEETLEDA